jgi:site-specific recombinase XerC
MKTYAKKAGLKHFHLHQLRHPFAWIVSEGSGSIVETQDALGHKNLATTRVYVQQIAIKKDRFSQSIKARIPNR